MRRWWLWLLPPWGRTARHRERVAAAREWQEQEHEAAIRRITDAARGWDGPTWGGPTAEYPTTRPLLTPGQSARSRQGGRL